MSRYMFLKYQVSTYCQGTEDISIDYALVDLSDVLFSSYVSKFEYAAEKLMRNRHINGVYEIDKSSIIDMTINEIGGND